MPHPVMSGSLPLLIVPLIADTIRDEMDEKGGFLGFPKDTEETGHRGWLDKELRVSLGAMSLVHKEWTAAAQAVLRRRVFLRDSDSLQRFMDDANACGPWVRELQYWCNRNGWNQNEDPQLLSQLLDRLSGLVALSIGKLPKAPCLSSATRLRALHIKCGLGTLGVSLILEAVANLHNLETLSLKGLWEPENSLSWSLPPILACSHPPAMLKRLYLDIEFDADVTPHDCEELLSWILQARGNYTLQELRLVVTYGEYEDPYKHFSRMLLNSVSSTLPALKTLLLGDGTAIDVDICRELLSRCTSLRELHLYPDPTYTLPQTLEYLCWGHDVYGFGSLEEEDTFLSDFLQLLDLSDEAPNLRRVSQRLAEPKCEYLKTEEACDELGIEYVPGCSLEGT